MANFDTCGIYFIGNEAVGLVKIGSATSVNSRLLALQCGSPVPLTLMAHFRAHRETERGLHEVLKAHRAHGEWFRLCDEVREVIALTLGGYLQVAIDGVETRYQRLLDASAREKPGDRHRIMCAALQVYPGLPEIIEVARDLRDRRAAA